jgi:hypothetical protein
MLLRDKKTILETYSQKNLIAKQLRIKESIDEIWLKQTPERLENLPSPPNVKVKTEGDIDDGNKFRN